MGIGSVPKDLPTQHRQFLLKLRQMAGEAATQSSVDELAKRVANLSAGLTSVQVVIDGDSDDDDVPTGEAMSTAEILALIAIATRVPQLERRIREMESIAAHVLALVSAASRIPQLEQRIRELETAVAIELAT